MGIQGRMQRTLRFGRRAYRYAVRRALRKDLTLGPTRERREQFQHLLAKLQRNGQSRICSIGSQGQGPVDGNLESRFAYFDIGSHHNILDVLEEEPIDAFYVNRNEPRDFVNLVNFLEAYDLDIPVLMGDQFRVRSLIGFVPVMPEEAVSTSINVHNYFAKNYRISDTLLCQGSLYQGNALLDLHQFLIRPDETKEISIESALDTTGLVSGTYFLEVFHPQLPASTPEYRYFGLYRDKVSGFMAGSHSLPRGTWHNSGNEGATATRTYIPNIDGAAVSYLMPGSLAPSQGSQVTAATTLGQELEFKLSDGKGSIDTVIKTPDAPNSPFELRFDRVLPGIPTYGGPGFQSVRQQDGGFALWHDGPSIRQLGTRMDVHTIDPNKSVPGRTPPSPITGEILADERQRSQQVAGNLLDLYRSRAKYFLTLFPYLGPSSPDLHVVFDSEQWVTDIRRFEIGLYSSQGTLIETKPFTFDGQLETVNLNKLFASELVEFSVGYWAITADPVAQAAPEVSGDLQFPSHHMLFGFWADGNKMYDSVHSVTSTNMVAFDLYRGGASEMAVASNRIVARTRKFAPFFDSEDNTSWFWICNVGHSEEKLDATLKVRLFDLDGEEGVATYSVPAGNSRILTSDQIRRDCKVNTQRGTVWLESNDCNMGAMWFVQSDDDKGFAVDHFTGA